MNTPFNLKQRGLTLALVSAFALGATMSGQSFAVEGTATATATVIAPIGITKAADLEFGSFAPGVGGDVTVSTSGARTAAANGVILSGVGATPSAAKFDVSGTGSSTYSIAYAGTSTTLSDGATGTMNLALISDLTGANTTAAGTVTSGALTSGAQSIYVGGILTVGATQAAGTYTGSVKVQVEYN